MSKQIHDIARSILSDLQTAGLSVGSGYQFWAFSDAKRAVADVVIHGRRLLADANSKEVTAAFDEFLCLAPPRSWAQLVKFLTELERGLNHLIVEHKPEVEQVSEWVYFRAVGGGSRIRRYSKGWPTTSVCQRLADGVWTRCCITVADAIGLLETPEFYECGEEGEPLGSSQAETIEWAYFQCLPISGRVSNYRRVNVSCEATDATEILIDGEWEASDMTLADMRSAVSLGQAEWTEAPKLKMTKPAPVEQGPEREVTDPETGHSYRVDKHGTILTRRKGDTSWCAANCNAHTIATLNRLGLLDEKPAAPAPAANVAQRVAQNVACELLAKMEAWGFDGDVTIVDRLDDLLAVNHLANRLRTHLFDILGERFPVMDINRHNSLNEIVTAHCAGWVSEVDVLKNWKKAHYLLSKIAITGDAHE